MRFFLLLVCILSYKTDATPSTFWGKRALKAELSGKKQDSIRFLKRAASKGDQYAIDRLEDLFPTSKTEQQIEIEKRDASLDETFKKLYEKQSDLAKQKTLEYFQTKLDNGVDGFKLTRFVNSVLYKSPLSYKSKKVLQDYFKRNSIKLKNISLNHFQLIYTTRFHPKRIDRVSISIQDFIIFDDGLFIIDEDFDPCILLDEGYGNYQTLSFVDRSNNSWVKDPVLRINGPVLARIKREREIRRQKRESQK